MTTTDELVAVLAKVDLFDGLDAKLLRRIADSGRVETFAPGATVLSEGEEVSGFRSFSPKGVEMHVVISQLTPQCHEFAIRVSLLPIALFSAQKRPIIGRRVI